MKSLFARLQQALDAAAATQQPAYPGIEIDFRAFPAHPVLAARDIHVSAERRDPGYRVVDRFVSNGDDVDRCEPDPE